VNGTTTGEVWAVGQSGQYLHYDPSAATKWTFGVSDTVSDLHGLWVRTEDDVWACGQNGTIERWTRGVGWQKAASTPIAALTAIWGRSETDVWAIASTSSIFHFDGTNWKTVPGPANDTAVVLNGLAGQADGTLWAVGKQGTILHYTGSAWERENSGLSTDLLSVAVGAQGAVWTVGVNQFILERMPQTPFAAGVMLLARCRRMGMIPLLVTPGELLDRITILRLRYERTTAPEARELVAASLARADGVGERPH
jgi:hypothetical protein